MREHKKLARTRGRCLADKSDQFVFYFLEGIKVVDKEHVSVAGLAANVHELCIVRIRHTDSKNAETWEEERTQEFRQSLKFPL